MARIGNCDITVGPHLFDAMLYIVKDPSVPPPLQYATPQRPMVHYGHPNNFQQYQPYPSPSNAQRRPPYPQATPARPPQGYPSQQRNQTHPAPSPSGQRPPGQNAPPGQPAKQNPDPVIQMLATRAAADPELKALMRVVASSQATQEQLRAFQAHIDELNAIIKAREQQEQRNQQSAGTPAQPKTTPQPATPAPQNQSTPSQPEPQDKQTSDKQTTSKEQGKKPDSATQTQTPSKEPEKTPASSASQTPAPANPQSGAQPPSSAQSQANQPPSTSQDTSAGQTPVKQEPAAAASNNPQNTPGSSTQPATPAPVSTPASAGQSQPPVPAVKPTPPPGNIQQPAPRPGAPYPPYQQPPNGVQPPLQSRPPQYNSPNSYYRPPAPPARPAPLGYKAVVFEFTSPLTPYGSSTSGHAGSGDRYLFPEYSILEWLPNESTLLASFLVVRKVDPSAPFPIESAQDTGNGRGKGKGTSKSKKGTAAKGKEGNETPIPGQAAAAASTETPMKSEPSDKPGVEPNTAAPGTPGTPAGAPVNEASLKEYWQPVTFRIHSSAPKTLEPLTRVVKPPDEVRKYMNEIMDRAERAPDGFPALRLPHEEAREAFEAEGTPASATNVAAASRTRPSRAAAKMPEEESEVENNLMDLEEEEEELKDFYGEPMGLPPLRA